MIPRAVGVNKKVSSLWFGPRQSGKSTLIRSELKNTKYFAVNLLESDIYYKYSKDPSQLRSDLIYQIEKKKIQFIFIDEVQKIPQLTNEIHNLIEKYPRVHFVLSGSSARKLKRGNANLLGGRAIIEHLMPLTKNELKDDFVLEQVLQHGSLVGMYFDQREIRIQKLKAYVDTYLREEIAQEGLVRNFELFHRFLDVSGAYHAEIINYTNIAREAGSSVKTIQNYFSILYETLLAFELRAWDKSIKRQLSKHPKFYFVDNGITNAIAQRLNDPLDAATRGKLFEQWFINEIRTWIFYTKKELSLYYWRTERGEYEVDLIISKHQKPVLAIELKAKKKVSRKEVQSLLEFKKEFVKTRAICVCECSVPYSIEEIDILPYNNFLENLENEL
ncbi:MAG: ATP-binding protein [Oligoflexia bacterium]|nr:ATP-binding protein [Oligoflexia bacterium]